MRKAIKGVSFLIMMTMVGNLFLAGTVRAAGVVTSYAPIALTEGQSAGFMAMHFETTPTANVTVTFAENTGRILFSPATLTFDPTDPNDDQQAVSIIADENSLVDGDIVTTISSLTTSADPNFVPVSEVVGTIEVWDNDMGISVGDVAVTEAPFNSAVAAFPLTLSAPSQNTVVVDYASANGTAEFGLDYVNTATNPSSAAVFLPGQTSVTVNVPILSDTDVESNETFFLNLLNAAHAAISDGQGMATIIDLPVAAPGVVVNLPATDEIEEGGSTVTFEFQLATQPTADVTVFLGDDLGRVNFVPATFVFTPTNYNNPLPVSASVDPNAVVENGGGEETLISYMTTSADANYNNPGQNETVGIFFIVDTTNPTPALPTISIDNVMVNEGDADTTATFNVTLSAFSTDPITVDFTTADGTAVANEDYVSQTGTITFAPGETIATLTLDVYGDELYETTENFFVTLANATNATIANDTGMVSIVDDADAPIVGGGFSSNGPLTEGGNTLAMLSINFAGLAPTSDVTVLLSDSAGQLSFSQSVLTFTSSNWSVDQTVEVNAIDDVFVDGDVDTQIQYVTDSADPAYDDLAGGLFSPMTVYDNDTSGPTPVVTSDIDLVPLGGPESVTEGQPGVQVFALFLTAQPTADVTITLTNDEGQISFDPAVLTFDENTWDVPQAVTITAIDDAIVETLGSDGVNFDVASTDAMYDVLSGNITSIEVVDNDTAVTPGTDTVAPVITLTGGASLSITAGSTYTDQGATASDDTDGDISARIVTVSPVNTQVPGTYIITYNVSDAAGNAAAEVTRTVDVVAAPVVSSGGGGGGGSRGNAWLFPTSTQQVPSPTPVTNTNPSLAPLVSPNAPTQVLGVKVNRIDELVALLRFGQRGPDVVELQNELKSAGFFSAKVRSTGYYGPITWKAVLDYKRNTADRNLLSFLSAQTKRGERNTLVRELQNELKKYGFLKNTIVSTGFYGPLTAEAVAKFTASGQS